MRLAKQMVVNEFGSPEVLALVESPVPSPKAGEILVRVEAAGVLYGDIMRRTDRYLLPTALPYAPGTEIAGFVVEIGDKVATHRVGDRVLSLIGSGGYAQYAIADAASAIHLPDAIEFGAATALLAQGVTAYLLTHDVATLHGKSVFIESAAGGVGVQMVQMARAQGAAYIVGSASSDKKRQFARLAGADFVVNPMEQNWSNAIMEETRGHGVDVGYESSGGCLSELLRCLGAFGTLVKFGRGVDENQIFDPSQLVGKNQSMRGFYLPGYRDAAHLPLLGRAIQALINSFLRGDLRVHISQRFPLEQAALAHREIEARRTVGKVVLTPWVT